MNRINLIWPSVIWLTTCILLFSCEQPRVTKLGEIVERQIIFSTTIQDEYQLDVLLPPDYSTDTPYPMVILLDGDIDFKFTAKGIRRLWNDQELPDLILVGLGYLEARDEKRIRDYTFPFNDQFDTPNGGGEDFLKALQQEFLPLIQAEYSVDTTQQFLMGHSVGGLQTLYTFFQYPKTPFNGFIAASPSLWWKDAVPFSWEDSLGKKLNVLPVRLFIGFGKEEALDISLTTIEMIDRLKNRNYQNFFLDTRVYSGASHSQTIPQTYLDGLKFLMN